MIVTGTHFNYYQLCHRKLWLFANGINMEQESDLVYEGKLVHESSYPQRTSKYEEEKFYSKLNYNTFIFEGKTLLTDLCRILNVDDEEFEEVEGDADTLAGLLLEIKGDFPSIHEKIDYKNYTFEVMNVEERRISKIKVTVHPVRNQEEEKK